MEAVELPQETAEDLRQVQRDEPEIVEQFLSAWYAAHEALAAYQNAVQAYREAHKAYRQAISHAIARRGADVR